LSKAVALAARRTVQGCYDLGFSASFQGDHVRRREFFGLIGGAAAWPLAARAQQQAVRRIGVISAVAETDPEAKPRLMAFQQALEQMGWTTGSNLRIDFRWNNRGDVALSEEMAALSREMVALQPEIILVQSNPGVAAIRQVTSTIPVVFVSVADPVESGFVESLSRPGGNGLEAISLCDFGSFGLFAGNWQHGILGVLQHYRHFTEVTGRTDDVRS
jgi:hypothetical protein